MGQKKVVILSLFVVLLAYIYLKNSSSSQPPREGKTIETNSGKVRGTISTSRDGREFYQWLKIPFAQPPVGNLRFESPKPVSKWEGILDGQNYGPKCAQLGRFGGDLEGEEDCLHLNINVPKMAQKEGRSLPVLVWIFGGAFISGSAVEYGADYFMDEDVVLVSINYRVGLLGFLTTGDEQIRGNMGIKDVVMGLKWVQDNIEFFGGNPKMVTLFGSSAGGSIVHHLLQSSKTRGLFHKAISQSGMATSSWGFWSAAKSSERTKEHAKTLNCPTESSKAMTECFRKLSVTDFLAAYKNDMVQLQIFNPTDSGEYLHPVIEAVKDDEAFITESPYDILVEGRGQKIPWLAGIQKDEALLSTISFVRDEGTLEEMDKNWKKYTPQALTIPHMPENETDEIAAQIRNQYFPPNHQQLSFEEKMAVYTQMSTDGSLFSFLSETARIQRKFSPVYLYYLNQTGGPSLTPMLAALGSKHRPFLLEVVMFLARSAFNKHVLGVAPKDYGICHGDELFYLFPWLGVFVSKEEMEVSYKVSKGMVKIWADFAADENSMTFDSKPFTKTGKEGPLQYFKIDEQPGMINEPFEDRMKFWDSLKILERHSQSVKNYGRSS